MLGDEAVSPAKDIPQESVGQGTMLGQQRGDNNGQIAMAGTVEGTDPATDGTDSRHQNSHQEVMRKRTSFYEGRPGTHTGINPR